MATLIQVLKYGLRMSAKNPAFTVVAVLTPPLGIGAGTATVTEDLCHRIRTPSSHPDFPAVSPRKP